METYLLKYLLLVRSLPEAPNSTSCLLLPVYRSHAKRQRPSGLLAPTGTGPVGPSLTGDFKEKRFSGPELFIPLGDLFKINQDICF